MTSSDFSVEGTASVKDEMGGDKYVLLECPVCEWSCVETRAAAKLGDTCPICAEDNGRDVYLRSREAKDSDKAEGYDARRAAAPSRDQVTMGALRYAEQLAVTLHDKHYQDAPQWRPLSGDLIGILTQIDNMTAGMSRVATLVPTAEQGVEAPLRFCDYCKSWHSKPCGNGCVWQPDMPTELPEPTPRTCTCHRDDSPPVPCAENYAFSECSALTPPIAYAGEEAPKQTDGEQLLRRARSTR